MPLRRAASKTIREEGFSTCHRTLEESTYPAPSCSALPQSNVDSGSSTNLEFSNLFSNLLGNHGGFRSMRVLAIVFALSAAAVAASHRPVCPGPAAAGTARCHAHVATDPQGKPHASSAPVQGYGP